MAENGFNVYVTGIGTDEAIEEWISNSLDGRQRRTTIDMSHTTAGRDLEPHMSCKKRLITLHRCFV